MSYINEIPIANKLLNPDGSITTLDGTTLYPADEQRAVLWEQAAYIPNKALNPDGSITVLPSARTVVTVFDTVAQLLAAPGYEGQLASAKDTDHLYLFEGGSWVDEGVSSPDTVARQAAAQAQATASAAQATANAALSTANTANIASGQALTQANAADAAAISAGTVADNANATAGQANTTASNAISIAHDADTKSNTAISNATTALSNSTNAVNTANAAAAAVTQAAKVLFKQNANVTLASLSTGNVATTLISDAGAVGSRTLPANSLQSGDIIRITQKSYITNPDSSSPTLRVLFGGNVLASTSSGLPQNITAAYAELILDIQVRTATTAKVIGRTLIIGNSVSSRTLGGAADVSINTGVSNLVDITYQWDSNTGKSITTIETVIEKL